MHDIDETTLEFEAGEFEDEFEDDFEGDFEGEFEDDLELEAAIYSPFNETEEMELAFELLQISSDEELEQFLGKVFKKAWRGIKKAGKTVGKIARPLGGILKGVAKKALPVVGGALGSMIPIPGVGTAVGSALGGALARTLEMELEGMSPEDQELEVARRFVRVAGTAAKKAAQVHPASDPKRAAKKAVMTALKQHVPQISSTARVSSLGAAVPGRSGRWFRRGRKIILTGV